MTTPTNDLTYDPAFMAGTPWNPGNDELAEYVAASQDGQLYLVTVEPDGSFWVQTRTSRFSQWTEPVRCRRQ